MRTEQERVEIEEGGWCFIIVLFIITFSGGLGYLLFKSFFG